MYMNIVMIIVAKMLITIITIDVVLNPDLVGGVLIELGSAQGKAKA